MKKKLPHHCGESNLVGQGHRKTGKHPMRLTQQDKYNGSGCLDMTAYLAIRNIERRGG